MKVNRSKKIVLIAVLFALALTLFFINPFSDLQYITRIPWYISRITAVSAFIVLTLGISFGLGMSTRLFFKKIKPPVVLETHAMFAKFGISLVIVHIVSLMFDRYLHLKIYEALIPFVLSRSFNSLLGYSIGIVVTMGIISLYLLVILAFTSIYRAKMSIKLWRKLHYGSFIAYLSFITHGYLAGSDSTESWMIRIYQMSILLVGSLILLRIIISLRRN